MRFLNALAAAIVATIIASCSPAPSPQQQTEERERDLMAPLKTKYPTVVTGYDFKGTTVDISVDPNELLQLGEDEQAAMEAAALDRWKSTWHATHSGHAVVTVRLIDFRGTPWSKKSARV